MARKPKSGSDGGINLDSLMDALTNVVAVLILVLVLVQADVTRKVVQFIEDMQPATPEQISRLEADLAQASTKRDSLASLSKDASSSAARIESVNREIGTLREQLAAADKKLEESKQLKTTETTLRAELNAQENANEQVLKQIEGLKDKLGNVQKSQTVAPKEVSIPDSRPIPEKAVVYHALCNANRVHIVDAQEAVKLITKEFDRNSKDLLKERVKRPKADLLVYDQTKVAAHFQKLALRNERGQRLQVITHPHDYHLMLDIAVDLKNGGTPMEDLEKKGSEFYNAAIRMKGDIRAVLMYHVNADSYDCYIKARDLTDKARIPAGWEVGSSGKWREFVPGITVNRLEAPPANKAAGPKQPPRVKPKLD